MASSKDNSIINEIENEILKDMAKQLEVPRKFFPSRDDFITKEGKPSPHNWRRPDIVIADDFVTDDLTKQSTPPQIELTHHLSGGYTDCGFTTAQPVDWPKGHVWSPNWKDVTCLLCLKHRS